MEVVYSQGARAPTSPALAKTPIVVDPLVSLTPADGYLAVGGSDLDVTLRVIRDIPTNVTLTLSAPGYVISTTPSSLFVRNGTLAGSVQQVFRVSVESGTPLTGPMLLDVSVSASASSGLNGVVMAGLAQVELRSVADLLSLSSTATGVLPWSSGPADVEVYLGQVWSFELGLLMGSSVDTTVSFESSSVGLARFLPSSYKFAAGSTATQTATLLVGQTEGASTMTALTTPHIVSTPMGRLVAVRLFNLSVEAGADVLRSDGNEVIVELNLTTQGAALSDRLFVSLELSTPDTVNPYTYVLAAGMGEVVFEAGEGAGSGTVRSVSLALEPFLSSFRASDNVLVTLRTKSESGSLSRYDQLRIELPTRMVTREAPKPVLVPSAISLLLISNQNWAQSVSLDWAPAAGQTVLVRFRIDNTTVSQVVSGADMYFTSSNYSSEVTLGIRAANVQVRSSNVLVFDHVT